jgi:hypothetical protein
MNFGAKLKMDCHLDLSLNITSVVKDKKVKFPCA